MPATGDRGKVLIIEDDPLVRDMLSQTLSGLGGYETDIAADGQDGLEKIREADFDIVFTDLNMPRLNGMEFLKRSRALRPSTPVVVITGVSEMEIAVNAMRAGATDFIPKPFRVDKLIATAERILGEKRLLGRFVDGARSEESLERLNAELFKRLQEIVALHTLSTEIDGQLDNRDIYGRIAGMAARLLAVNEASFGIIEEGRLDSRSAVGAPPPAVPVAGTFLEEVAGEARYRVADVGDPNPVTGTPLASQYLAIPLVAGNETFGILSLSNKADGTAFSREDIYLAVDFARKTASKIENNALYEVFFNNLVDTLKSLIATVE
ncbi:MAG TPA: response regulator, partial [Candidatus Limnocylindrales bacterium]